MQMKWTYTARRSPILEAKPVRAATHRCEEHLHVRFPDSAVEAAAYLRTGGGSGWRAYPTCQVRRSSLLARWQPQALLSGEPVPVVKRRYEVLVSVAGGTSTSYSRSSTLVTPM